MRDFSKYWKALNYTLVKYGDLKRKLSNIPYVIHPLRMTLILRAVGFSEFNNEDMMIATLFHDLLEDTDTRFEEIEKEFGNKIVSIVKELTIPNKEEKDLFFKNLKNASYEAKIVKLADRIDNLMDIPVESWSNKTRRSYAEQAKIILNSCGNAHPELATKLKQEIDKILNNPYF